MYSLTKKEIEAMLIERHTKPVYEKLQKAKVAIAGLGGLGSHIAVALVRMGVGHLYLVDFDKVDSSNLNRQYYRSCHIGVYKTKALKEELKEINPWVDVQTNCIRVTEQNAVELFKEYPIVCEAFDRPEEKAMLINTLLFQIPSVQIVGASGMAGYKDANQIRTEKVMNRFYLCGDQKNGIETGDCLMAPRVMICAGHQANKVLQLLLQEEDNE